MKKMASIVLVGIGGMGSVYLESLLQHKASGRFRLAGTVDIRAAGCPHQEELRASGIPAYATLEDFYSRDQADLAIISSPIHFHSAQACLALSRGSRVLCEKPAAATVQEVRRIQAAERSARRWVAVGYQWSFSSAIQSLKHDIRQGLFGLPRLLKCLYLWPRSELYYKRNDWAGRIRDNQGRWILDSPVNNAMAHDLHNMFYVLGKETETADKPVRLEAELYRAHDIENFDTAAIRCFTESGAEILFFVSHAAGVDTGPVFSYAFERGEVTLSGRDAPILARLAGAQRNYGVPDAEPLRKMWEAIDSVQDESLPVCGLEAALGQVLAVNGAQDSPADIRAFPRRIISSRGEPGRREISVEGLAGILKECYEKNRLPSELGASWSRKGRWIDLDDYVHYPGGREYGSS
ncbi:MAG: Gfo/Idh/MocA family oxidoreductase [Candidatus Aminicenantes bacterium]|nr:Gfo/Idh/MocA family oxidoreductase [Candidatus Aminicenantes bacterium]